jgi:ferrous iron transport protein B
MKENKTCTIAVVGNPNCGKTTLFNALTGSNQRIGNWPGVTVEKKDGKFSIGDFDINLVDLPGIYSLSATSEDEKVARDYILSGEADLIIDIIDATNLERNLYLTTQLLEMDVPLFLVVNMMDLAEKRNIRVDVKHLEAHLKCPVVGISAVNSDDIKNLSTRLKDAASKKAVSSAGFAYPDELEREIEKLASGLKKTAHAVGATPKWAAIKLLEGDRFVDAKREAESDLSVSLVAESRKRVEQVLKETPDIVIADARYGFIQGIARDVVKRTNIKEYVSDKVDKVVLNRVLGIPIFLVVMYLVFWVTIQIGGAFIDFFDILFGTIFVDGFGVLLGSIGAPAWLIAILAGGVGAGLQTIATFVPVIFFMFLMLSLLEDSGYMARAAFVMDRFMRFLGLPGKSFVPMLVGFGCTVPAIMGTRTLENRRDRILTIFMTPFMSCGARLPVYALFGAAFFGRKAGLMVFSLYMAGIILAIVTGLIMKKTLFKGEPSHFIMELPPYHAPRMKHIMIHTWNKLKAFLFRAGKVILIAVTLLGFLNTIGTDGSIGNEDSETSVLSVIGSALTPVFQPMGVEKENWPAAVALFTGLFAKEAVVGTLNGLYGQMDAQDSEEAPVESADEPAEEGFDFWGGVAESLASIPANLAGIIGGLADPLGVGIIGADEAETAAEVEADESIFAAMRSYFSFGAPQAYAYLLFVLLYFPCLAAMGAAFREMGAGYGTLLMAYLTLFAWIVATLFFQITVGHSILWILVALALFAAIIVVLRLMGKKKDLLKTIE